MSSSETYDIRTTVVTGIVCKKCGNKLPPMTMEDHLEGRFNKECPHTPTEKEIAERIARIMEHVNMYKNWPESEKKQ